MILTNVTQFPDAAICGLDEAGRGPLAGPLVAAAVILPFGFDAGALRAANPKLRFRDSKKLSAQQRERLLGVIEASGARIAVETISVAEIDEHGIGPANRAVFERLIEAVDADLYIVDGNLKLRGPRAKLSRVQSVVRADEHVLAVLAASIVAKVRRDAMMVALHAAHPEYGWNRNHGYGTKAHIAAIGHYGPTPHHRRQFVQTALSHLPGMEP